MILILHKERTAVLLLLLLPFAGLQRIAQLFTATV